MGLDRPTLIQQAAMPLALAGSGVIATAQTGSGKTAAFLLPLSLRLEGGPNGHTRALILSPTREIAAQTAQQWARLAPGMPLRTMDLYGGLGMARQSSGLRATARASVEHMLGRHSPQPRRRGVRRWSGRGLRR
jgi:superfamily II DNA/RNA helicase